MFLLKKAARKQLFFMVNYNSFIVSVTAMFLMRLAGLYTAAADDRNMMTKITANAPIGKLHESPK